MEICVEKVAGLDIKSGVIGVYGDISRYEKRPANNDTELHI